MSIVDVLLKLKHEPINGLNVIDGVSNALGGGVEQKVQFGDISIFVRKYSWNLEPTEGDTQLEDMTSCLCVVYNKSMITIGFCVSNPSHDASSGSSYCLRGGSYYLNPRYYRCLGSLKNYLYDELMGYCSAHLVEISDPVTFADFLPKQVKSARPAVVRRG